MEKTTGVPVTPGQMDLIERLSAVSTEREKLLDEYLGEIEKGSIHELTMRQAGNLINRLSSIRAAAVIEHYLTRSQLTYLDQLQDTQMRRDYTQRYLSEHGKRTIHAVSSTEASELISVLKSMKPPSEGEKLDAPLTIEQMERMDEMQDTEERRSVTMRFLGEILHKEPAELTRQEADELLGLLE